LDLVPEGHQLLPKALELGGMGVPGGVRVSEPPRHGVHPLSQLRRQRPQALHLQPHHLHLLALALQRPLQVGQLLGGGGGGPLLCLGQPRPQLGVQGERLGGQVRRLQLLRRRQSNGRLPLGQGRGLLEREEAALHAARK